MNSLYDIIEEIRPRPVLFLGRLSITSLRDFLGGYQMALDKLKINENYRLLLPLPFWFFHEYVAIIYNYYESTSGWCNMILKQANNNEEDALHIFFGLFDKFKALSIKNSSKAVLVQNNIDYHHTNKYVPYRLVGANSAEREPLYRKPIAVYYFELADDLGYLGIIETDNRYILLREIYRSENEILQYLKVCFGNHLEWKLLESKNISYEKELEY